MEFRRAIGLALGIIFVATPAWAQLATFEILHAEDHVGASLSADGTVVGISGASASGYAFAHDLETDTRLFGVEGLNGTTAPSISGDGSAAHGRVFGEVDEYFFYENGTLSFVPGTTTYAAGGISHDGSVITLTDSNRAALRTGGFTGPLQYLDASPGTGIDSVASDVSADGRIVAGSIDTATGTSELFRWSPGGGLERLGQFGGSERETRAAAISADGSTIVGNAMTAGSFHEGLPFLWRDGAFTALGALPGDETGLAFDVSGDGARVVGSSGLGRFFGGGTAFVWDEHDGLQDMSVLLQSLGIDLTDIELHMASAISADGRTIVGTGYERYEYAREIVWKAVLPPVPEPTTGLLLGLGLLGLAGGRPSRERER